MCFLLLQALPGDPLDRLDSPNVPAEQARRNREALGLDRPPAEQLLRTLRSWAAGDLGASVVRRRPVADVLRDALPYSLALGCAALALAYGIGVPLAVWLVARRSRTRRVLDRLLLVVATMPRFWLGVVLVLVFHAWLGWLPASHTGPPGESGGVLGFLRHLVLPALTLGLPAAAVVCRYQRAVLGHALEATHVRAARAAGAGGVGLLVRHVLRPAAAPSVALFGLDLPVLVSGAVVAEVVFAWPGMGRVTAEAVLQADYPLALAATALSAATVVAGRGLAAAVVRALDPRQAADGTMP